MATTVQSQQQPRAGQRFLLHDISWSAYEAFLSALGDRPGLRLTYDGASLEFMTILPPHEILKKTLGRLVEMLCWELQIPIKSGGSFTHKREDRQKGLEPDECYWIQNEPVVRGKRDIDLTRDPPPDLALEIDITRSSLDRLSIYASLEVPEVWRFDGQSLSVYLLQAAGEYRLSEKSSAFPFLPVHELVRFMQFDEKTGELAQLQSFVAWIRRSEFVK